MSVKAIGDDELLEYVIEKDFEDTASRVILRAVRFFPDGIGKKRLAKLLKGMDPDFVISRHQGARDHYGRLSLLSMDQILDFIESLIRLALVEVEDIDFPRITITPSGERALGREDMIPAMIPWPLPCEEVEIPTDYELFRSLKDIRNSLAREEEIPPYCVASNQSLVEMVNREISDIDSMMNVKGMGDIRCGKYGESFLRAING